LDFRIEKDVMKMEDDFWYICFAEDFSTAIIKRKGEHSIAFIVFKQLNSMVI